MERLAGCGSRLRLFGVTDPSTMNSAQENGVSVQQHGRHLITTLGRETGRLHACGLPEPCGGEPGRHAGVTMPACGVRCIPAVSKASAYSPCHVR